MNFKIWSRPVRLTVLTLILCTTGSVSWAQQATTATYEDWVVECQMDASVPTPHKLCTMSQISRLKDNNTPFSRIAFEKPAGNKTFVMTAQLPVNVSLKTLPRVQVDQKDTGVALILERCVPGGCFASLDVPDDMLKRLRGQDVGSKLIFKDAASRDVTIPISLKGFKSALEALPQ